MRLVVHHQFHAVIDEHAPLRVHQQLAGILVSRLHGNALKVILLGVAAHAVHRCHPQAPLFITEQTLHVVIGQTQGIVGTEILVIGMTVVAVQTSKGGNPQLPCGILRNGLHTTVRQFLCHHERMFFVLVSVCIRFAFLLTCQ